MKTQAETTAPAGSPAAKIAVGAALAAAIVVSLFVLPVRTYLAQFLSWIQGVGPWGAVAFAAVYVLSTVLFIPGFILTLGGGFVFGVVWGTVLVSLGSTLGAAVAFLLGRTLMRGTIEAKVAGSEKFRAIDRAVGREGFKIVLLTRLSPVFPFNLLNYGFGVTKVPFRDYFFASWMGMLPGTIMYVYLGSAVKNLADVLAGRVQGGAGQNILFGLGLLATIAVTVLVTRIAKKALSESVPDAAEATHAD